MQAGSGMLSICLARGEKNDATDPDDGGRGADVGARHGRHASARCPGPRDLRARRRVPHGRRPAAGSGDGCLPDGRADQGGRSGIRHHDTRFGRDEGDDRARAGAGTRPADPVFRAHGRRRRPSGRLGAQSVHAARGERRFLRSRHHGQQGGRHRADVHDPAAARREHAASARSRVRLCRRRRDRHGDDETHRGPSMGGQRRVRHQHGRRRRPPRRRDRQASHLPGAGRREDLRDVRTRCDQSRRPQLASPRGQCDLPARARDAQSRSRTGSR